MKERYEAFRTEYCKDSGEDTIMMMSNLEMTTTMKFRLSGVVVRD